MWVCDKNEQIEFLHNEIDRCSRCMSPQFSLCLFKLVQWEYRVEDLCENDKDDDDDDDLFAFVNVSMCVLHCVCMGNAFALYIRFVGSKFSTRNKMKPKTITPGVCIYGA